MKTKLLTATLFATLFGDGRRVIKKIDEDGMGVTISKLDKEGEPLTKTSHISFLQDKVFERYADLVYGKDDRLMTRAMEHGLEAEKTAQENLLNEIMKNPIANFKMKNDTLSGELDLVDKDGKTVKQFVEIKSPESKGKLLKLLYTISKNKENQVEVVREYEPSYLGQIQFYYALTKAENGMLLIYDNRISNAYAIIDVKEDPHVLAFIGEVAPLINNALTKIKSGIEELDLKQIDEDEPNE